MLSEQTGASTKSEWCGRARARIEALASVIRASPGVLLWPLLLFSISVTVGVWLTTHAAQVAADTAKNNARSVTADVAIAYRQQLSAAFDATQALAQMVESEPQYEYTVRLFRAVAKPLVSMAPPNSIELVQLLPSAVIRLVYPQESYGQLAGLDMYSLQDPRMSRIMSSAASEHRLCVDGPISLPLYGEAPSLGLATGEVLLARKAIRVAAAGPSETFGRPDVFNPLCGDACLYNATSGTALWGMAVSVIRLDALTSPLTILRTLGLRFTLTTSSGNLVAASPEAPQGDWAADNTVAAVMQLPGTKWFLRVGPSSPSAGWKPAWYGGVLAAVVVLAAAAAALLFGLLVSRRRHAMLLEALLPRELIRDLHKGNAAEAVGRTTLTPESPAEVLLRLLGSLLEGEAPDLRQLVLLRTLLLSQADWYRPLGINARINGANLDTDVAGALMQQLQLGSVYPGGYTEEGADAAAAAAATEAAAGTPEQQVACGTLTGALGFILSDDNHDPLVFPSPAPLLMALHSGRPSATALLACGSVAAGPCFAGPSSSARPSSSHRLHLAYAGPTSASLQGPFGASLYGAGGAGGGGDSDNLAAALAAATAASVSGALSSALGVGWGAGEYGGEDGEEGGGEGPSASTHGGGGGEGASRIMLQGGGSSTPRIRILAESAPLQLDRHCLQPPQASQQPSQQPQPQPQPQSQRQASRSLRGLFLRVSAAGGCSGGGGGGGGGGGSGGYQLPRRLSSIEPLPSEMSPPPPPPLPPSPLPPPPPRSSNNMMTVLSAAAVATAATHGSDDGGGRSRHWTRQSGRGGRAVHAATSSSGGVGSGTTLGVVGSSTTIGTMGTTTNGSPLLQPQLPSPACLSPRRSAPVLPVVTQRYSQLLQLQFQQQQQLLLQHQLLLQQQQYQQLLQHHQHQQYQQQPQQQQPPQQPQQQQRHSGLRIWGGHGRTPRVSVPGTTASSSRVATPPRSPALINRSAPSGHELSLRLFREWPGKNNNNNNISRNENDNNNNKINKNENDSNNNARDNAPTDAGEGRTSHSGIVCGMGSPRGSCTGNDEDHGNDHHQDCSHHDHAGVGGGGAGGGSTEYLNPFTPAQSLLLETMPRASTATGAISSVLSAARLRTSPNNPLLSLLPSQPLQHIPSTTLSSRLMSPPLSASRRSPLPPVASPPPAMLDAVEAALASAEGWQFDCWALAEATGGRPLSVMGFYLLQREGLLAHFGINPVTMCRLLRALEAGYPANPYHNATHAADVLRSLHVLLRGARLTPNYLDPLGLMAAYFAAIIHDHGHPGLTGDFLAATSHPLAVRYNDRSPLENHHAASAFALLMERPDLNAFAGLSAEQRKVFRKQVMEMVLATDMKQHFTILSQFNTAHRLAGLRAAAGAGPGAGAPSGGSHEHQQQQVPAGGSGFAGLHAPPAKDSSARGGSAFGAAAGSGTPAPIDLGAPAPVDDAERMLSLQVALKVADVGHLGAQLQVHQRWLAELEEEFFQQGDRERELGLPISPLFDRDKQGVSKSQVGFYDFVALPLVKAMVDAFPGAAPLLRCFEANKDYWAGYEQQAQQAQQRRPGEGSPNQKTSLAAAKGTP